MVLCMVAVYCEKEKGGIHSFGGGGVVGGSALFLLLLLLFLLPLRFRASFVFAPFLPLTPQSAQERIPLPSPAPFPRSKKGSGGGSKEYSQYKKDI